MRKNIIKHALLGLALIGASSVTLADYSADDIAKGKALYLNKKKGNCIACHMIPDADAKLPGNQGPPLLAMKARFPDSTSPVPPALFIYCQTLSRSVPFRVGPVLGGFRDGLLS